MNRRDQEKLLAAIFEDGDLADARASSLSRALAESARRRRRIFVVRALAPAAAVILLAGLWLHSNQVSDGTNGDGARRASATSPSTSPATVGGVVSPAPEVKFITDEELFALFQDRAVAVIGPPGRQQFVVLDAARSTP